MNFVRKVERDELEKPAYRAKELDALAQEHKDEFLPHGAVYQSLK